MNHLAKIWFLRVTAVLIIVVGLAIANGWAAKAHNWLLAKDTTNNFSRPQIATSGLAPASTIYAAPEIQDQTNNWINSPPLTIAGLHGKVVLVDFWTFECINCQHTQPYLNKWYDKYHADGLEIIGVHAPEFAYEQVPDNVRTAVKAANIKYPVVLDNDFATWHAYNNEFWPARYLIDKQGQVRYYHPGEGAYDTTEDNIKALLKAS